MLGTALAIAQTPASDDNSSNPFGLPPPYKPPAASQPDNAKPDNTKKADSDTEIPKGELPPEEDKSDAPKYSV